MTSWIPRVRNPTVKIWRRVKPRRRSESKFRNLRSAAESGWDFSSRWFADGQNITTIKTTDLIPVDLNCLLYHLEVTLARAFRVRSDAAKNDLALAKEFDERAEQRKNAINEYCWS